MKKGRDNGRFSQNLNIQRAFWFNQIVSAVIVTSRKWHEFSFSSWKQLNCTVFYFLAAVEMARTVSSNKKRRLPIWSDLKNHFAPFWTVATALQFFCCEIDSAITILQYTLWPRWHSWKSSRRGKTFYGTFHGSYYGKSQRQRRSQDFLLRSVGMESSLLLSILPSLQS